MSCCGGKRAEMMAAVPVSPGRTPLQSRTEQVYFQYIGRTSLIAVGGATGLRYQFSFPGAVVATDPRDRRSLAGVPHLRQVLTP